MADKAAAILTGDAGTLSFGLAAARPNAGAACVWMTYNATDTGQLSVCLRSSAGGFSWYSITASSALVAAWASQTAWFINSATGSDASTGLAALTALKTWTELRRRIVAAGGFAIGLGNVTVTLLANLPASDPLDLTGMSVPEGTALVVAGSLTTSAPLFSGTMGVVVVKNTNTNTTWSFTDASIPVSWTASGLVNKRGRSLTGVTAGATFWIAKDIGAKAARITSPITQSSAFPCILTPGAPAPTAGDTYVIEQLIAVASVKIAPIATNDQTDTAQVRVILKDIAFTGTQVPSGENLGCPLLMIGCSTIEPLCALEVDISCSFSSIALLFPQNFALSVIGGYCTAGISLSGQTLLLGDFLAQSCQIGAGPGSTIIQTGDIAIFDATGPGLQVSGGASYYAQSNRTFGSGAAQTFGITVKSNSRYIYNGAGSKPTITGVTNDTSIGGVATAYAGIPTITAANGAAMVLDA